MPPHPLLDATGHEKSQTKMTYEALIIK